MTGALLGAIALGCDHSPPPPPPEPPAPAHAPAPPSPLVVDAPAPSTLREGTPSFSVGFLPLRPPKADLKKVIAQLASEHYPALRVQPPGQPVGAPPVVIAGSYRWGGISAAELDASGKGLSAAARAALSRPMEATALEFHVPGKDALASLRLAQQLAGALVQRVDGVLVDGETHELFSPDAWKGLRMSWVGPVPAVITQITLRKNGGDAASPRLVTYGMAKFGLPDITVTDPPGAAGPPAATRIHLLCQLMVEGQLPAVDGTMTLNALQVRERATKKALLDAQLGGPQFVRLRKTNAQAGDPENRLLEMLPAP